MYVYRLLLHTILYILPALYLRFVHFSQQTTLTEWLCIDYQLDAPIIIYS